MVSFRRKALCVLLCFLLLPQWALADVSYPANGVTSFKVNLRSGPGTSTEVLAVINKGVTISLTGAEGNWYAVSYSGLSGYIRKDLVSVVLADGGTSQDVIITEGSGSGNSGTSSSNTSRNLRQGHSGEDVRALQQQLKTLGYLSGAADGIFGAQTATALRNFQSANGLYADGVAGAKTYAKLYGGSATGSGSAGSTGGGTETGGYANLRIGSKGEAVRLLQQALNAQGYNAGSADGVYGAKTATAVRSFQAARGLSVDGIAGAITQQALHASGASSGNASTGGESSGGTAATAAPTATPAPSGSSDSSASYRNLQRGSTGEDVVRLQKALKELGYYSGEAHGTYDDATREAVIAFQRNNGTGVDGVAGPATQRILYERTPVSVDQTPTPAATLAPGVGEMSGPSKSDVQLLHWFNEVKTSLSNGQNLTIYDPVSSLGWTLKVYARGNHCDSEPLTAQDTAIMNQAFGNATTWNPKAVYVKLPDGRWSLATMHNVPHLTGSIKDNNFDGHLCVHFYRDMDEVSKNDPNYGVQNQNALRTAWEKMK